MVVKPKSVFLISLVSLAVLSPGTFSLPKGVNGGVRCLGCTAIVSINQQLAEVWNTTFTKSYKRLCSYLPPTIGAACSVLGRFFLPLIVQHQFASPDVICHAIGQCYTEKGQPECKAYPNKSSEGFAQEVQEIKKHIQLKGILRDIFNELEQPEFDICKLRVVSEVCKWLNHVFGQDLPIFDLDGDKFSSYESFRGYAWRGKDCNDFLATHYPGRKPISGDVFFDSNCNGISGFNLLRWKTWEEVLCEDSGPQGTIVLGDSVTAHFHIPPEWLTATEINQTIFKHMLFVLENEFDWPMMSGFTAFLDTSAWPQIITGPIDSVYKHIVDRNLCNHRDYQNIGKNGADSFIMNDVLLKALARNNATDYPALVFYSLSGDDVCNSNPEGQNMTTPEDMKTNALKTMDTLDKILAKGSHVVMLGLADGGVLYDSMHNRIHPLGKLHKDITYSALYDFMNCLQVSPCAGWLNSNESIRNATTERAKELSKVLENIAETQKYKNFDLVFLENFFADVIKVWKASGKDHETWQLIEPVGGFHPDQTALALSAKVLVETIQSKVPHFLGEVNPHNDLIKKLFGNQGGYT